MMFHVDIGKIWPCAKKFTLFFKLSFSTSNPAAKWLLLCSYMESMTLGKNTDP